ncbi:hypothetical protein BJ508DRAFT_329244 [Ascobolus immersus RN42]|uniref:Uncharacterized protein n=1 Tax=Ascobolus immersus RN42 TaxID=1160509 RepID=A0A3N4HZ59_ASCIM|nr:hypothetical protein BJ508DRAFT_329244 [Ascobolus immersus RN42]
MDPPPQAPLRRNHDTPSDSPTPPTQRTTTPQTPTSFLHQLKHRCRLPERHTWLSIAIGLLLFLKPLLGSTLYILTILVTSIFQIPPDLLLLSLELTLLNYIPLFAHNTAFYPLIPIVILAHQVVVKPMLFPRTVRLAGWLRVEDGKRAEVMVAMGGCLVWCVYAAVLSRWGAPGGDVGMVFGEWGWVVVEAWERLRMFTTVLGALLGGVVVKELVWG